MNIRRRIFSGIQPTGIPHIGNYLGAIKNWVHLQNTSSKDDLVMFCVVDQHSCTTHHDPIALKNDVVNMVASLLACGIDPEKSLLFQQSQVPHHSLLSWYLSCLAPIGQLKRMHQWKTKSGKEQEHSNLGLFSYPVLMAADILLYRSTHVPVGHDQLQHIELTRDLTQSFNKQYGEIFPLPESILTDSPRIMSLRKPQDKMSKSDKSINSRIDITDTNDTIATKLRKAVTDSEPYISHELHERHGVRNLISILSALDNTSKSEIIDKYDGVEYFTRDLKSDTTDALIEHLSPIRAKYIELASDRTYLSDILRNGSEKANEMAQRTMRDVNQVIGVEL